MRSACIDEEVEGRCPCEVFPDVGGRWHEIHRRALEGETLSGRESPFTRADGTIDLVDWEILRRRDPAGEIGGVVLFTQFVTERVELERMARTAADALAERKTLMATAIDGLTDVYFQTDASGTISAFNTAFATFHGFENKEACAERLSDLPKIVELRFPDGRVAGPEETPILRALRGEEAQALSEELNLLIDSVMDYAIHTLDREGRVAIWNDGARRQTRPARRRARAASANSSAQAMRLPQQDLARLTLQRFR